jgi:hypothetical protein
LYSEDALRKLRSNIYFAPISSQYKRTIRNMIKLLALHGIYAEDSGEMINTSDAKGNPRRPRPAQTPRPATRGFTVQRGFIYAEDSSMEARRVGVGPPMAPPQPQDFVPETADQMIERMRRDMLGSGCNDSS